jgi:hypothetical protein
MTNRNLISISLSPVCYRKEEGPSMTGLLFNRVPLLKL